MLFCHYADKWSEYVLKKLKLRYFIKIVIIALKIIHALLVKAHSINSSYNLKHVERVLFRYQSLDACYFTPVNIRKKLCVIHYSRIHAIIV